MSRPYLGLHGPWQAVCPKTKATEGWGNGQGEGVGSWTSYPCRTGKGAGCLLVLTGSCAFGLLLKQCGGRRWCFTWLHDVRVCPHFESCYLGVNRHLLSSIKWHQCQESLFYDILRNRVGTQQLRGVANPLQTPLVKPGLCGSPGKSFAHFLKSQDVIHKY